MSAGLFKSIGVLVVVGLVAPISSQEKITDKKRSSPELEVQVSVSHPKDPGRAGDWLALTFEMRNVGTQPFYIPPVVNEVTAEGGFKAVVLAPAHARIEYSQGAADFRVGYARDVVEEVTRHWLLLPPGEFYGGTILTGIRPLEPGTYKIIGRRDPPRFSNEEKEQLEKVLKFPVLQEIVDSAPLYLRITR